MSERISGPDRKIVEIAQSLQFMAEDLDELADKLAEQGRHDYLAAELRAMIAVRTKLKYNIRKLERLTGQAPWTEERFPF